MDSVQLIVIRWARSAAPQSVLRAHPIERTALVADENEDWSKDCDHNWIDMVDQDGKKIGTICSSCGASGG